MKTAYYRGGFLISKGANNMNIQKLKIQGLQPATYNPRKDLQPSDPEYQKIKRSIEAFGYIDPVIVNQDMTIIGGHQRVKVLQALGYDEIDCVLVDLNKDQEKALNIALNKISGEWDDEALKAVFLELEAGAYDLSLTGFDTDEFNELMGRCDMELQDDDFDVQGAFESITEPTTKKGDIWQLGKHKLMCGDSTSATDTKTLMGDKQARLIITDPPYNVAYEGQNGMTIQNDSMGDQPFFNFLFDAFTNMFTHAEPGCPIYVFHADTEGINFRKAYKDAGFKLAECLVWVKNALVLGRQDYHWRHEPILYGWKEGAAHHWYGERDKTTVFETGEDLSTLKKEELLEILQKIYDSSSILYENKPKNNALHPTMKPLGLLSRLIYNSSVAGDLVFDPFGGSGSTLIAAEQTQRTCFTMELDERYCDVIVARYEELTSKSAILIT